MTARLIVFMFLTLSFVTSSANAADFNWLEVPDYIAAALKPVRKEVDVQPIIEFMKPLNGEYSGKLVGSVSGKDLWWKDQTVDCSNVDLGIAKVDMGKQVFNSYVRSGPLSIVSGFGYFDDNLKIVELNDRVLKVSNVSYTDNSNYVFSRIKRTTVLTVTKDADGKLESFSLQDGAGVTVGAPLDTLSSSKADCHVQK